MYKHLCKNIFLVLLGQIKILRQKIFKDKRITQTWVNSAFIAKCRLNILTLYIMHEVTSWGTGACWEISSWLFLVPVWSGQELSPQVLITTILYEVLIPQSAF